MIKPRRIGHATYETPDLERMIDYYTETMGLTLTEEISWQGHHAVSLRANTEHHTIALYPRALRAELALRPDSICMAYGMQVGSYAQLKAAIEFLKSNAVTIKYLPPELFPGIDYSATFEVPVFRVAESDVQATV